MKSFYIHLLIYTSTGKNEVSTVLCGGQQGSNSRMKETHHNIIHIHAHQLHLHFSEVVFLETGLRASGGTPTHASCKYCSCVYLWRTLGPGSFRMHIINLWPRPIINIHGQNPLSWYPSSSSPFSLTIRSTCNNNNNNNDD